ncbi:hypothetical protein GBAR_LOCUS18247 [Geodia barretti]|nr:hypothetical protein GBAR_LOCUS18247 [Geodia barretti]
MWVCFTTDPSIDMWNITLNSSCVKCKEKSCDSHGIPNRPHWTVDRSETGCSGDSIIDLSVLVKDFSKRDTGRLMLTWSTDSSEQGPQQHQVLTVTSLRYKESLSGYVYAGIGVGGGCVVLGVSVVAVVIGRFWYKRKKTAAQRARRRAERRHAARNGGGRGEDEASDNDNDRQHLVGGGDRGYGAIPRHGHGINSDTAPSEIENEVVLQTDSEGTTRDV